MSDLKPDIDDAFKGMPSLSTPGGSKTDNSAMIQKKTSIGGSSVPSETKTNNLETGTKVYVGKKQSGAFEINLGKKLKDTTLSAVSIDTDCNVRIETESIPDTKTTSFSQTSIETDGFGKTLSSAQSNSNYPFIIEEDTESSTIDPSPQISQPFNKKEKLPQPNLSLDISSAYTDTQMPKGNEPVPVGSGVVTGILGSGGMAKVYRIWNEKLEVHRAVKILLPSHRKESYTRFQTEAKISAKLHHPNIVEIHSIGEWNNLPYIEMELIEGDTLNALITRYKALPSVFCSAVAVQVARALEYAHCKEILIYGKTYQGLIHRDLKPSNIIIEKSGKVKLMDFGVARPMETGLHTINTENLVGTMHYFSPEQIDGHPIDQLSDVYSFGAVLYEMLCGLNPFPQASMIELVRAKIKNQFIRLEDHHIPFDPHLASVAQICLRTEKANRFESSLKLRVHLEELHNSFGMGTPENVVASFFNDPQLMYKEAKDSISRSIPAQIDSPEPEQKPRDLKDTHKIDEKELIAAQTEMNKIPKNKRIENNNKHKIMIISLSAAAVVVAALVVLIFK